MKIGLVSKGTNNKHTYNLTEHLMIDLEIIIAFSFMTSIVNFRCLRIKSGG